MGCLHDTANIPTIRLRVGEGRSHPERESSPTGAKLPGCDAPSAGRSADPLERVLQQGSSARQPLLAEGRIIWLFLVGRYLRFCPSLKGKEKGRTLTIQWRFVSCDPLLMPGFWCSGGLFSFLVFGLLSARFLTGGIVRDAGERLRGIIRTGCDERFGSASGDGLGGCVG